MKHHSYHGVDFLVTKRPFCKVRVERIAFRHLARYGFYAALVSSKRLRTFRLPTIGVRML